MGYELGTEQKKIISSGISAYNRLSCSYPHKSDRNSFE